MLTIAAHLAGGSPQWGRAEILYRGMVSSLILIIARLLKPYREPFKSERCSPKTALPDLRGVTEERVNAPVAARDAISSRDRPPSAQKQ